MTINQILDEQMKEIDSRIQSIIFYTQEIKEDAVIDNDLYKSHFELIRESIHSYTRKLIESLAEEIVGEKVQGAKGDAKRFNYDPEWYEGYNACIAEQRLKVKEILSNLK